jgi:hypothetical protein
MPRVAEPEPARDEDSSASAQPPTAEVADPLEEDLDDVEPKLQLDADAEPPSDPELEEQLEADAEDDEEVEAVASASVRSSAPALEFSGPAPGELPRTKSIQFPSASREPEPEPEPDREPEPELEAEPDRPSSPSAVPVERAARLRSDKSRASGLMGAVRVAAVMGAAGAVSFGLVTWARGLLEPSPQEAPAAAASASAAVPAPTASGAPAATAQKASASDAKVEQLPLPLGIPLADGKGLLEVDIGERHAIYVDGTFVGRGPLRRVPLDPGKHQVELRQPGEEKTFSVEVSAGSRTRLGLQAAK